MNRSEEVEHLGRPSTASIELPQAVRFEQTPKPLDGGGAGFRVTLNCREFTSRCPVTSQPDYAELRIEYEPRGTIIETKSLKLYLQKFRDRAAFNEELCQAICDELFALLAPGMLSVEMSFAHRGGISVNPKAVRWTDDDEEERVAP